MKIIWWRYCPSWRGGPLLACFSLLACLPPDGALTLLLAPDWASLCAAYADGAAASPRHKAEVDKKAAIRD
ncbi:Uncharacterised protein [Bordetella pertussis]|nr:Uncharacterised protein [Bordetella pertussis]